MDRSERFDQIGGEGVQLLENNQVCEKKSDTSCGDYARGKQKYSSGQHRIRLQLEQLDHQQASNGLRLGIISSHEGPIDLHCHSVPAMCFWVMDGEYLKEQAKYEYQDEDDDEEDGKNTAQNNSKWSGANLGDIIQLNIDCDHQKVTIQNEKTGVKNTKAVDLDDIPFPWELIASFTIGPDRVRLL